MKPRHSERHALEITRREVRRVSLVAVRHLVAPRKDIAKCHPSMAVNASALAPDKRCGTGVMFSCPNEFHNVVCCNKSASLHRRERFCRPSLLPWSTINCCTVYTYQLETCSLVQQQSPYRHLSGKSSGCAFADANDNDHSPHSVSVGIYFEVLDKRTTRSVSPRRD